MSASDRIAKAAISFATGKTIDYIKRKPDRDLSRTVKRVLTPFRRVFPAKRIDALIKGAGDINNPYRNMLVDMALHTDGHIIKTFASVMGWDAGYRGTKTVRSNREKYKCNIPWLILIDPTSACNKRCKGCWSAEYGHKFSLSLDEMRKVISEAKSLGTHVFMFTGGEPLIRKADIITLCEENRDCIFLAYTNGTLIDDAFCADVRRVGNITFALSVEGTEVSNDARRGEGSYAETMAAMRLLRSYGCLFGISVCYTRANVDMVTSDSFLDEMIAVGAKFALYFNYMPVGRAADKSLITTPAQREYMYHWIRRVRNAQGGKPLFTFDFQNDGEYVGGCIAGGRNYFHVNSNGDMEPCVFIHFSDSNIREKTVLEALQSPLFMEYHKGQPFNNNHLRPCPMLENPDKLRGIIHRTGAKPTDFIAKESVEELCAKCDDFAYKWKPVADRLWADNPHPDIYTQYYRDTDEGRRDAALKKQEEENIRSQIKKVE